MMRGNPAVESVLNRKLRYLSLPETLKEFFLRGRHNLVVTGTHGKTTVSSLLAWIFENAGLAPGYFIGGIPVNLGQGACLRDSKHFIVEGDEYDTAFFDKRSKFMHYLPELVIVNNIEFDHADIYRDLEEIKTSFRRLLNIVPSEGMLLLNADDQNCLDIARVALRRSWRWDFPRMPVITFATRIPSTAFQALSYSAPASKCRSWGISISGTRRWRFPRRIFMACLSRKSKRP